MKKIFTFFLVLAVSMGIVYASDTQVDGIWYDFDSNNHTASVTYYGSDYFSSDTEYSGKVIIPENVTYNGITYSVTSIGYEAFCGCYSLTSVTIPNSVTSIGRWAFCDCSKLTKTNYTGDIAGWCNIKFGNSTANPMYYSHKFYINDQEIKDLVIPNTVDSIHDYAFYDCPGLTSVTIPNSVTSIGNNAFSYCSSLPSVTIPNSVTSIGDRAFEDCSKLTLVTINSNAIVSKDYSSYYKISDIFGSQVTEYIIGDDVKGIGKYAFEDCDSLTSVTIPNSVTSIGDWAFYNCSKLTKTNYTGDIAGWCNIEFGDQYANPMYYSHNFYINGQKIKDLVIPNSVTSIGNYAFYDCTGLTSVTIGNSVTSIGEDAFAGCYSLTKTNYTGDIAGWCNIKFGNVFANPIYYSDNFYINDQEIKDLVIPNSVTSIGWYAFSGCSSLTSVTIGESVTSIGERAFGGCKSLTSITCEAATPPTLGSDAFDGVSMSIPVYVPCGCVKAYKAKSGWKDFTNIQGPLAEYSIEVNVNDTIMGTAEVDYNTFCEGNQISATPNIGYHFVQWSDGNTENPRTLELTQDTILTAEFAQSFSGQCGDNLYWELVDATLHITGSGEMYNYTSNTVSWKLLVSSISSLTIAEDVTSIERSAFSDCTAIESIVWNAKNYANPTNKEIAPFYDIRSQIKSFTFGEAVEHVPAYLCYGMETLTSMTIPNSVKSIGTSAFEGCIRLSKISLGIGLEEIAANTFAGCTRLYDIYVYATYPPFAEGSSFANYNVYVYIPCEYQRDYILDVVWGKFKFIECIDSEEATTDGNVTVVPGFNDVTITWPTEEGADTYTIVIKKDGEVFCTLTFNAEGQLLNIAFAPSRDGDNRPAQYAEQAVNGYRFTVTNLESGTKYGYNIDVKDASNKTIKSHSGEFTTQSTTALDNTHSSSANTQKLLRDGLLLIIRDGVEYNAQGVRL